MKKEKNRKLTPSCNISNWNSGALCALSFLVAGLSAFIRVHLRSNPDCAISFQSEEKTHSQSARLLADPHP